MWHLIDTIGLSITFSFLVELGDSGWKETNVLTDSFISIIHPHPAPYAFLTILGIVMFLVSAIKLKFFYRYVSVLT